MKTTITFASTVLLVSVFSQPAAQAAGSAADCKHFNMVSYGGDAGIPHRKFLADPFEQKWGAQLST
jgi:hypothetical protein